MKKKSIIKVLLAAQLLIITPSLCFAWGAQGHRLIVETALSLLSPQAKQKVLSYLGNYNPDLAAVWLDSVRINHVPQYSYTKNWHFLNMEANQTYADVQNNSDVIFNLQQTVNFFSHIPPGTKPDVIVFNLKVLFHLMGDITQPLHVGYGSDTGGNDDPVTTAIYNQKGNNIHHVWDDIIITDGKINLQTSLAYYHHLTAAQINTINSGNAISWMLQARSYLPQVYACHPQKGVMVNVPKSYLDANVSIVQQQLVYAASRLANVLQKAFGS